MVGHLLGYDLKERGIVIAMIHVRYSCHIVEFVRVELIR